MFRVVLLVLLMSALCIISSGGHKKRHRKSSTVTTLSPTSTTEFGAGVHCNNIPMDPPPDDVGNYGDYSCGLFPQPSKVVLIERITVTSNPLFSSTQNIDLLKVYPKGVKVHQVDIYNFGRCHGYTVSAGFANQGNSTVEARIDCSVCTQKNLGVRMFVEVYGTVIPEWCHLNH